MVEHPHRPGRQIVERDPPVADRELPEVGVRPAIGGERDGLSVGRPDGVEIAELVLGEPMEPAAVAVHHEEVAEAALVPGKHEPLAVRAPRGRGDAAQGDLDPIDDLVAIHVHDQDLVPGAALRREGQELSIRRPVRLAVDEAVGLVVAADARLEDPALDLAGDAVGEVHVHRVEVLLAEVHHPRPVGRERWGEVQRPLRPLLGQELVRHRPGARLRPDLGQVALLDRVAPLLGQLVAE